MPEDDGGKPFPERDDHGADEEFASVVFDEAFVKAASFHEPSARERLLALTQARAAAEAARLRVGGADEEPHAVAGGYDGDLGLYGGHYRLRRPYGATDRWHRSVAWLLALIMGLGVVALTFAAVYRGASSSRQPAPAPPPATGSAGVSRPPAVVGTADRR
ncbi:hypothetical protein POF50_027935 [Streptomyces sp. SL13]|uniref:Uncharacterized protein n=1 Tax=Streptantibioticus silvisoli TaxID=2705255 RepID=A0AA90H730_9ACTN|nr:hypothetical protein [Streptantibioticus silvisoli]MDI5964789.1 hypothetical protein [Streptantibioticus silvisoli]MDI5973131.1 hypothetical protein [Streptantibioticus silvisoli]